MTATGPVLVACAHGTRSAAGRAAIARLLLAVRAQRPELTVVPAFVDVQQPSLAAVLDRLDGRPSVVVPLLLSAGYHVHVDIAEAVAAHATAVVSDALGPSPLLADALVDHVRAAGARGGEAVVLAAAGSSDRRAVADVGVMCDLLGARWSGPIRPAFLSAAAPTVPEAVAGYRRSADPVVVALFLLAPGFFAQRTRALAVESGVRVVGSPLASHPGLAALVVQRYLRAVAPQQWQGPGVAPPIGPVTSSPAQ